MTKNTHSTNQKRSSSSAGAASQQQLVMIAAFVAIVASMGCCYFLAGSDPAPLFSGALTAISQATPAEPPPTAAPAGQDWWEVYFTDPATINDPDKLTGSIPEKLIERIDNAQQSIHIAAFEFNLSPVAQALIAAHKRGVEVQWVTDDENGLGADGEEGHGQFAMLKKAGIKVKDDQSSALMHNKFVIFDKQMVWTGSSNLTVNGNFRNNNNVIVIKSPEVAAMYEREFAEMWAGQFGPTSPSTANQQSTTLDGTPIQVLFAPEDKVMNYLVLLVKSAKKDIAIMAFSFTHDKLGEAVMGRAKAGVDVNVIFETSGSKTRYSELTSLYCARVPVRQDGNPGTFHHKVIVIDDEIVVTGSLNFSASADEDNDENVVVVTNRAIAALYLQEFERRWVEAREPDAESITCK
jgi:phosphatidylserine/phosphatidylglycerophosphate/cardiolipin synthase-like enzyme